MSCLVIIIYNTYSVCGSMNLIWGNHFKLANNIFDRHIISMTITAIATITNTAHGLIYNRVGSPLEVLSIKHDIPMTFSQSVHPDWIRKPIESSMIQNGKDASNCPQNSVHVKWMASSVNPSDINQIEGIYALRPLSLPAVGGN